MKYLFLIIATLSSIVFILGLIARAWTGVIVDSYYPSQITSLVCWGFFCVLNKEV